MSSSRLYVLLGILILFLGLEYGVYNWGVTNGEQEARSQLDAQIEKLNKQVAEQNAKISVSESQMAKSAVEYELLRTRLQQSIMENQKWKDTFVEAQNRAFSIPTVERLNYLLQH